METVTANLISQGFCRISIDGGTIAKVERLEAERVAEPFCSPGFVDLQINGARGVNFSAPDLTAEAAAGMVAAMWATGVTTFCPTLVTSPLDLLERNLRLLEEARGEDPDFAASVPCYHVEGPYLSPGPSHGAHDPALMRRPDWAEFTRLQQAAGGNIGILTIAPELAGAAEMIRRVSESGVVVAIGHTDGTASDIHQAVEAGARLSTHLGNGCPEFIHRHRSPLWAQLVSDELSASMICDGFHLPAEVIQAIARLKGVDRSILVTDAIHVAGLPPGPYELGTVPIELLASGQVVTRTTPSSMAGSTLAMNRAIAQYRTLGGVSLEAAVQAATANPARLLARGGGVCQRLEEGAPANLVLWRGGEEELQIEAVWCEGRRHRTPNSNL